VRLAAAGSGRAAGAVALAIACLAWLVLAPTASADLEPANETLAGAEGPLTTNVDYTGSLAHAQDESDWYFFYAAPQVELKIAATPSGCDTTGFNMNLFGRNAGGFEAGDDGELGWGPVITYTTPPGAPRLYYLSLSCDPSEKGAGAGYKFRVTSNVPGALIPGEREFRAPTLLGEPNEAREQAIGPLAGEVTYQGATTTENDQDWFYFYAKPAQQIELAVTGGDPSCQFGSRGEFRFYPSPEGSSKLVSVFANGVHRIWQKTDPTALRRYEISASCPGSSYLFRIAPASALASQACVDAAAARDGLAAQLSVLRRSRQAAKRSHANKVRRLTRRKRHAQRPAAKRRIARALKRSKRQNRRRLGALAREIKASEKALAAQQATALQLCA
jgi:hypothetical protein